MTQEHPGAAPAPGLAGLLRSGSLERRFVLLAIPGFVVLGLAFGLSRGWRSAAVALLTSLLVGADFLWLAKGLRLVASPEGPARAGGGGAAAALGLGSRSLLLLLGLYGILTILPGEGAAAAGGIVVPLALLASAGLLSTRS